MAKNCQTCKHLEWIDGDGDGRFDDDSSGWSCNGREPTDKHERQLQNEKYLRRYKRCFEPAAAIPASNKEQA